MSTDAGQTWTPLGHAEIPADNEYSSGWMYGRRSLEPAETKKAWVRVQLNAGGYSTGLIEAQAYGVYRTEAPQALAITYAWKEDGQLKTHRESVAAGTREHMFFVPTGPSIRDEFVRLEAP
jgi:hypothetical protein